MNNLFTISPEKLRGMRASLTRPATTILDNEQRQRASLLAALSMALFGAGLVFLSIWVVANPQFTAAPAISAGTLSTIAAVYILSRTRLYSLGAALFIVLLLLLVAAIILTAPGPMSERMLALNFLVVAIVMSSLLFNIPAMLLVSAVTIAAIGVFFFVPGVPFVVSYSYLVFVVTMSALLLIAAVIRNRYLAARNEAEATLAETETRFRNMFVKHSAMMLLVEPNTGNILDANQAAESFYGYPVSTLRTKNAAQLNVLFPEKIQQLQHRVPQKAPHAFTSPHQLADGTVRLVEVHAAPIPLGSREAVFAVIHDVTEREQATTALIARTKELRALQKTLLDVTSPRPLAALLETIVERAARLLNSTSGGLYLTELDTRRVRCVVSYNTPKDFTGTTLDFGEGAAGYVAQTGQPLIIDDYRTWPGRAAIFEADHPFQTVMSAPLLWQGRVTGVIHVLREAVDDNFTSEDLDLLVVFASHAAVAVENARLRSQLEQELTERKQTQAERERLIDELQTSLAQVKRLSGLLPICASCKKIKNDAGYWQEVSMYIRNHSEAEFSHGLCPDCMKKLYPEFFGDD